jgi:hypothetical protein
MKLRVCYSLEMTTEQFERLYRLAELAPIDGRSSHARSAMSRS